VGLLPDLLAPLALAAKLRSLPASGTARDVSAAGHSGYHSERDERNRSVAPATENVDVSDWTRVLIDN
jgi:hypothetical protein